MCVLIGKINYSFSYYNAPVPVCVFTSLKKIYFFCLPLKNKNAYIKLIILKVSVNLLTNILSKNFSYPR